MRRTEALIALAETPEVRSVGRRFKDKPEEAVDAYLNELGADGWEIVHPTGQTPTR